MSATNFLDPLLGQVAAKPRSAEGTRWFISLCHFHGEEPSDPSVSLQWFLNYSETARRARPKTPSLPGPPTEKDEP